MSSPASAAPALLRDRVVEFRRVPRDELLPNPRNWRRHPEAQRQALREVLQRVGVAGAVLAYYSERNGGQLTLIDGALRQEEDGVLEWPTLILDVTDAEAEAGLPARRRVRVQGPDRRGRVLPRHRRRDPAAAARPPARHHRQAARRRGAAGVTRWVRVKRWYPRGLLVHDILLILASLAILTWLVLTR